MADAEPAATTFGSHTNRRDLPSAALIRCRVCWEPIAEASGDVEEGDLYPYFRCPRCGCAFPIRREDIAHLTADRAP